MKRLLLTIVLMFSVSSFSVAATCSAAQSRTGEVDQQVRKLQERMMNDEEIMALVMALSADPEMQELMNDPAVLGAISSGDYDSLSKNPRIMRLLENARVKEIQRRLGQ